MLSKHKMNCMLVISRAGWIKQNEKILFQDNDGFYLDNIADNFDKLVILGQEYFLIKEQKLNYNYQFSNNNINLKDGMGPLSISNPFNLIIYICNVLSFIKKSDIVYGFVNTIRGSLYLLLSSIIFNKPTIAYCGTDRHALLKIENITGMKAWIRLYLEDLAIRNASVRIVTGPLLLDRYKSLPLTYMASPISAVIKQYPLSSLIKAKSYDSKNILCVAHLHQRKNIHVILHAMKFLKMKNISFHLNIVGDGPAMEELVQLVISYNLIDNVTFHGYVNDPVEMGKHYLENDIFLFSSLVEGFPRAVWEALHFGLYIIMVKVGGVEKIFDKSEMTILDIPDPELFAESIIQIMCSPVITKQAAIAAQSKFSTLFDKDPVSQFKQCLSEISKLQ